MKVREYIVGVLIGLDQLGNTLVGGNPDETISSRIGWIKRNHGGEVPWHHPVARVLDWCLDKIDPNHSIDAIEYDEHPGEGC